MKSADALSRAEIALRISAETSRRLAANTRDEALRDEHLSVMRTDLEAADEVAVMREIARASAPVIDMRIDRRACVVKGPNCEVFTRCVDTPNGPTCPTCADVRDRTGAH